MLFQTTAAHEELRAKIRSFAEEEIKPLAFLMDQNNEFPEEAVKKLGKLGWMGIPYPKEYGGAGLDALSYAIAVEELARVDGGAGVILSAHVSLGSWPIFAYGTEEQKKKYLVPLAKGEKIGAFGLTEPNAGSDAAPWAMPSACAAMPMRPPSSVDMAILKPSPSLPNRFSLGTFTSLKISSAVEEERIPILS